ncbi:MAG: outer membrane beta-barrel protein [Bacteroidales bacterium]|nr:outer membrane beta-barrel protein [Candidatus Scybalocola fimicaballi]
MKNKYTVISLVVMLFISTLSASANDSAEATTVNEASVVVSAEPDTPSEKVKPTFEDFTTTLKGFGYGYRMGFTIGGITPVPLPAEIREMVSFSPNGAFMQEIYGYKMLGEKQRLGIYFGERLAVEGMNAEARVKNYQMSIEQGGDYISGYFTGIDKTEAKLISLKMPLEFMVRVSPRLDFRVGPYAQINLHKEFKGEVYDGYLRENTPVGQKIVFSDGSTASYDFSDDVKNFISGAEVAADFKINKYFGVFGNLDLGFGSVFPDNFETITFKMYPIFFSLGVFVGI